MRVLTVVAALLGASVSAEELLLRGARQPMQGAYRNAWDDCGGMGASATQRMRTIAAGIKGFAKPEPFKAHAGQDCGSVDTEGFKPGNRDPLAVRVLPGMETTMAAADGLRLAKKTLEKYAPKL